MNSSQYYNQVNLLRGHRTGSKTLMIGRMPQETSIPKLSPARSQVAHGGERFADREPGRHRVDVGGDGWHLYAG